MKKIAFTLVVASIALTSCFKKSYDCHCNVDLPDTAGYALEFDTTFAITAHLEEEANVKCVAAEEATSFLATKYEELGSVTINCNLE